jgi:diguanylate cyclase (GGDEF)-like protein
VLAAVVRPLAHDETRAGFWVRHLRLGVLLTELSTLLALAYVVGCDRPRAAVIVALGGSVLLLAPLLLLVPIVRWSRDRRGSLVFYSWSAWLAVMIGVASVLDGRGSPLVWLLVLTMAFAVMAYPPVGVLCAGGFMLAVYTVVVLIGGSVGGPELLPGGVLAVFTTMMALVARNTWRLMGEQLGLEARLRAQADTDPLTGCLNRRALQRALTAALTRATPEWPVALCLLDLDGFKQVNDARGHAAGDATLVTVAETVRTTTRGHELVARLGGDEFAVVLPGADEDEAMALARRIVAEVGEALSGTGVSVSVGVATATGPIDGDDLIAAADARMYDAKARGGAGVSAAAVPTARRPRSTAGQTNQSDW